VSKDAIKTVTSSDNSATDQDYTSVTGTDFTVSGIPKRAADVNNLAFPFNLEVQRGNVEGFTARRVVGKVLGVTSLIRHTVWTGGIVTFAFPSVAAVISIFSDNANDTLLGTGARTLFIEGVDGSGNFITEAVNLNGTSPVTSVSTFLRLNVCRVSVVGSTGRNEGTITMDIGAIRIGRILPEENTMFNTIFSVPNNRKAYVFGGSSSILEDLLATGIKQGQLFLDVFPSSQPFFEIKVFTLQSDGTGKSVFELPFPIVLNAGDDVIATVIAHKNDTTFAVELDILVEDTS